MTAQGEWRYYHAADGLGSDDTRDIIVDQRGRIWVATKGGISRFDGAAWQTFTTANLNLPQDNTVRLVQDTQGRVWVLSALVGLSVIHEDDTVTYIGNPDPLEHGFHYITLDAQGHLWLAALEDLLVEYDPGERAWHTAERITDHFGQYARPVIWGIATDRQPGHLWVATENIVEIEGEEWRLHLPEYAATAVFVDAEGYKWFTVVSFERTSGGLVVLSPDSQQWWYGFSSAGSADAIAFALVRDIARDALGNYWFATGTGLMRFTPDD